MNINPGLKDSISGAVAVTGPLTDAELRAAAVGTVSWPLAIQYDDAGSGIIYIGKAVTGSSTASAVWQIQKLDESSSPDFSIKWADGNGSFDNVWDNRASLSYS